MSKLIILSLVLNIIFLPFLSAQEQENKQEVTEEFFYAEEEVEIASLKPQKVEEAPGIVSVITAQQIKDMGARDLNDVLRTIPGFQLSVGILYAAEYGVRGLKESANSRILVMLDGVTLNEAYDGQSNFNWADMPINNVKRIEIIRGPGSALYGTYAFLAAINIITNKAEDIDGIEFSAGGGSWNTQHHYLLFGKKKNDFSFSGYVDYRKSNGFDNYWVKQDLVTLLYSYVPFLPSVSQAPGYIQVPLDSKRLDLRMGYKDFEFQFKAQDYKRGAPLLGMSVTDGGNETDKCYIGQAIYKREVSDKLSLSLRGYYNYHKVHFSAQSYPEGIYGPLMPGLNAQGFFPDGFLFDLNHKIKNIGFQTKFDYFVTDKNTLTFGAEFNDLRMEKPIVRSNTDPVNRTQSEQLHEVSGMTAGVMDRAADRKVLALFIQDTWQIVDKVNLTAGLRADHYSDFGSTVNPRLSLVWKLRENTNIKLLYGHAFRAPIFADFYTIAPNKVGNENLGPEKVRSFEVGINHKFTPDIIASINYFYNALTDIILPTGEVIIEGYPPQLMNSGKVNSQGIEAEIKANFEKNTYAYFNYSYAKAKDELTGEVIPNIANNLFNFGLNVGAWKYLNANLNVNFVGDRKRGNQILPLFGIPDPRDPIKAYSLFDLTLRGRNFWKNTEVIFSIHNLLNTEYTDPEEQAIIYYDFPREGRQILGKVIFKF
jgi:outer membrane receptor for ferrienterochelin and colicins